MIAPRMKGQLTGFDTLIWTLKRYKLGKLKNYTDYVKKYLSDWEKALEFVDYYVEENNILKDMLNPFLPEIIKVKYRTKDKFDKKLGIKEKDYYLLAKILQFYTYREVAEEDLGTSKIITFQLYTKQEVKDINSETYRRFFEIKKEQKEKELQRLESDRKAQEHKDWIDWQMELYYQN